MKKIINDNILMKIVKLSVQGYTNNVIAKECNIALGTLFYWKKKLRQQGITVPNVVGRPLKKLSTDLIGE